jgi:hypothetical protein
LTLEMLANSASLITSSRSTSTSPTPWMTAAHHADLLVMDDRVVKAARSSWSPLAVAVS